MEQCKQEKNQKGFFFGALCHCGHNAANFTALKLDPALVGGGEGGGEVATTSDCIFSRVKTMQKCWGQF
jgi:hypothetical protein